MRLAAPEQRARAFTWNVALLIGSGALLNQLAGALPPYAALLGSRVGLSGTQVVMMGGAALTALAIPCYWGLRLAPPARRGTVLRLPAIPVEVRVLVPAVALWMLAEALVQPFFNVFFADRFALSVAWIGTLFATALLVRAIVLAGAAELSRRFGPERALAWWMVAAAPSLIALAITRSMPVAVGLFVVQGFVAPATNPLIDQLLLERVREDQHGVVAGWRNAAAEIAGAVGATAGGHLLNATSFTPLLLVAGVIAAVSGVLLIRALRAGRASTSLGPPASA
jgi:predicted MFS family arabinose efflux permease